ncbi:5-formyltetrahydrofolate cyclo-ligase [Zongyangia hominis]|uniref:5-formyltetrahydrofolate cyclo-ligase n=1 Tax=Zongyangia hominis TaxID=2763677 RepID=A0A926E8L0_9FIRM|nr:5-formyltetrahydrofolate cyclo-ligase [Zongyangia hominis]MBC8569885.1 5-formyltetrahydrofolate cyclo-ligase [Zongyangia hominis]
MLVADIRQYKRQLREKVKQKRRDMDPEVKRQKDLAIKKRVESLYQYKRAKLLLCYVSTDIEVDTKRLMEDAWRAGKKVAVPCCIDPGKSLMEFYYIRSFQDLKPRTFGVLEPDPERAEKVTDFSGALSIVPGLCFDYNGYRLGYGKGYYDRFLSSHPGPRVGIVYSEFVRYRLYHGRYDVPMDLIVTERYLRATSKRSKVETARVK